MKVIRQRYILFEIIQDQLCDDEIIEEKIILNEIWKKFNQFFGVAKSFEAGLWMIRWDPIHKYGILRCDNISRDYVIASMAFIRILNQKPCIIHTRQTSGTIKQILKYWRESFKTIPPKEESKIIFKN